MRKFKEGENRRKAVAEAVKADGGGFTPAVLKALANGPIIDPLRLYLPDGRLSPDQAAARDRRALRGDP